MRFFLPLLASLAVMAVEIPPEVRPIMSRLDAALSEAERLCHVAQAKAKEDAVKEMEKLLKAEQKKKASLIRTDLEVRIAALTKDIALLKDEPLLQATELDIKISKKEMTEDDWASIPGQTLNLDAKEPRSSSKIKVAASELYFIVPHPSDTWKNQASGESLTWRGKDGADMKLMIRCGEKEITGLFVNEIGLLTLGPNDKGCGDNEGSIRVKIIRVH